MTKLSKRNPERTKELIHDAALAEFAQKGYGSARVDTIAARAGVNKRMLYHYYGNKDDLFLYVLERIYEKIRSHEAKLDLEHLCPIDAVRELVNFTFAYHYDNPEFIALLNNENLYEARHIKKSKKIRQMHSPFVELVKDVLIRGEKDGVFRKNIDPVQFYITVVSVIYFYLSNIHTLSTIFDRNLKSKAAMADRLDHCMEVILGYLRPDPPQ
ncbi:Transcriptional regulator, AcrR family [hydrothermal vent metagenome]|uniref:Transcriptional regulator, AcrR family n=1 Tax=hydrothermal vent metagenome TaxID=652676 RepID=A0A3B0T7X3_9ZZZZ